MKWHNKGHEYDAVWARMLCPSGKANRPIWIFGAGVKGRRIASQLKDRYEIAGFVDNDEGKQGSSIDGYEVISAEAYASKRRESYMVLCVSVKYQSEIIKQLEELRLTNLTDFCTWEYAIRVLQPLELLYGKNKLHLPIVQLALTERCTLRCKKCAHGCAYAKKPEDLRMEQVRESVDSFFSIVDYVDEFYLIGGEPMLYENLDEAVVYVGENYRDRIGRLSITTNGTIIPSDGLLDMAEKYHVFFRVSDYAMWIKGLREKYDIWMKLLDNRNIPYVHDREGAWWTDYGFDHVNRGFRAEELAQVFDNCPTPCREIRGSRFYYCIQARAWRENAGLYTESEEFLDLRNLPKDRAKHILFEYNMGFSEKGYLDMCNYCYGADMVNHPIPAAEQIK